MAEFHCTICNKLILPGTPAVSVVGGQFPEIDPDFFMIDQAVLNESYLHLACLVREVVEKSKLSTMK